MTANIISKKSPHIPSVLRKRAFRRGFADCHAARPFVENYPPADQWWYELGRLFAASCPTLPPSFVNTPLGEKLYLAAKAAGACPIHRSR